MKATPRCHRERRDCPPRKMLWTAYFLSPDTASCLQYSAWGCNCISWFSAFSHLNIIIPCCSHSATRTRRAGWSLVVRSSSWIHTWAAGRRARPSPNSHHAEDGFILGVGAWDHSVVMKRQALASDGLKSDPSPATSYDASSGKPLRLGVPLFPHLRSGDNKRVGLTGSSWGWTERNCVMAQTRGWQTFPINVRVCRPLSLCHN